MSGILSFMGRKNDNPLPPVNLIAELAGGILTAFGVITSLYERKTSGKGQVVDTSMVEGAAYISSYLFKTQDLPLWGNPRGENIMDGGVHFYNTYKTKDGKFMAVGSIEPKFYHKLMEGLSLSDNFINIQETERGKKILSEKFATKTQKEWTEIFNKLDACVTPVLDMEEVAFNELNKLRNAFVHNKHTSRYEPQAAPRLSRTPGNANVSLPDPEIGEHTIEIMKNNGFSNDEIEKYISCKIIGVDNKSKL